MMWVKLMHSSKTPNAKTHGCQAVSRCDWAEAQIHYQHMPHPMTLALAPPVTGLAPGIARAGGIRAGGQPEGYALSHVVTMEQREKVGMKKKKTLTENLVGADTFVLELEAERSRIAEKKNQNLR